jgi:hypothetical protein
LPVTIFFQGNNEIISLKKFQHSGQPIFHVDSIVAAISSLPACVMCTPSRVRSIPDLAWLPRVSHSWANCASGVILGAFSLSLSEKQLFPYQILHMGFYCIAIGTRNAYYIADCNVTPFSGSQKN